MKKTIIGVVLLCAVSCGPENSGKTVPPVRKWKGLVFADPWIREPAPGQKNAAAYLTIGNNGKIPAVLSSVSTQAFRSAQIHRTVEKDGLTSMRLFRRLPIAPGRKIRFMPGGFHIMLVDQQMSIPKDSTVFLRFRFTGMGAIDIPFAVRDSKWQPVK